MSTDAQQSSILMRKDIRWLISFCISILAWILFLVFFPIVHLLVLAVSLLHIPVLISGIFDIQNCFFCRAHCHNDKKKSMCALTFDDGPDPEFTPQVLDMLQKYNFRATFFLIAKKAQENPELVQKILSRGHCIACHDLGHGLASNFRLYKAMYREIGEAQRIIGTITGKYPRFYRPPVGMTNPHLRKALHDLDMECIGWSSSVRDGGNRFSSTFLHFPELARPGSVVLLHDTLPHNNASHLYLDSIEILFRTITEKHLEPVTVDELFDCRPYKEGSTYKTKSTKISK